MMFLKNDLHCRFLNIAGFGDNSKPEDVEIRDAIDAIRDLTDEERGKLLLICLDAPYPEQLIKEMAHNYENATVGCP